MKAWDFDAVAYDGEVYCIDCLPDGVSVDSEDVFPVFADSEWDSYPVCAACGERHDYVGLTSDGAIYEAAQQGFEVFEHNSADADPDSCWIDEDGQPLPSGWYWWSCQPSCLPDGEPNGPFDSESAAAFDAIGL